jgi:hypothetical protein
MLLHQWNATATLKKLLEDFLGVELMWSGMFLFAVDDGAV